MNLKRKKVTVLFCMLCMLILAVTGCGLGSAGDETESPDMPETADTAGQEPVDSAEEDVEEPKEVQDNPEGRWHVLAPEVAAAVDADFCGMVYRIEEDTFFIAEEETMLDEDGALISSHPSPSVEIPDSDLIEVIFDEDTYFYIRTIQGNGESHEDTDASFSDLEKSGTVEMKGYFEQDVFHAKEIRIVKVS